MNLQKLYDEVKKRIYSVEFSKMYEGFKPYRFALYDDQAVCLDGKMIEKTDAFMANTAIAYDDDFIAIWHVTEGMDLDVLSSKLAHEMFHAHQMKHEDKRFPNELETLYNYQYNIDNLTIKYQENLIIDQLVDDFSDEQYEQLLALRKKRCVEHPYEFHYEAAVEEIEGNANYIELEVLKQLSKTFYETKLKEMKSNIKNIKMLFPIRIISYDIGALLMKIIRLNKPTITFEFDDQPYSAKLLEGINPFTGNIKDVEAVRDELTTYEEKTESIIKRALDQNNLVVEGDYDLLAVNIYNARYRKPYIISMFFMMYLDGEEQVVKNGNFLIELSSEQKVKRAFQYD